jgi:glycosyltransferase involved in cell wall biosynthesis
VALLIIQIPCLNEEHTLAETIRDIPRSLPGIDRIEVLIIDDGSTDRTIEVARGLGVHHVVRFPRNRGLAKAFASGLDACLRLGADYIVNTDGDNQYGGECIAELVRPLVAGEADVVIGDRNTNEIAHFSWFKKRLQSLGSLVVRGFSRTDVPDATSGFRGYTREAARRLNLVSEYTYTLESIIQAGQSGLHLSSVPVRTNRKLRESRLIKSIRTYVQRSAVTILRSYVLYRPLRSFMLLAGSIGVLALLLGGRFLWYWAHGQGAGKVQSVVLAASLGIVAVQLFVMGLLADLVGANRKLIEELLVRVRRVEAGQAGGAEAPAQALNPREKALP